MPLRQIMKLYDLFFLPTGVL